MLQRDGVESLIKKKLFVGDGVNDAGRMWESLCMGALWMMIREDRGTDFGDRYAEYCVCTGVKFVVLAFDEMLVYLDRDFEMRALKRDVPRDLLVIVGFSEL